MVEVTYGWAMSAPSRKMLMVQGHVFSIERGSRRHRKELKEGSQSEDRQERGLPGLGETAPRGKSLNSGTYGTFWLLWELFLHYTRLYFLKAKTSLHP